MNKQELFEKIDGLNKLYGETKNYVAVDDVLNLVKLLDEPQKPVVPQFVADFIAEQKKLGHTLSYSIDASMSDGVAEWYWDNSELFAHAWLDGYENEKEKRYLVKIKGNVSENILVFGLVTQVYFFSKDNRNNKYRQTTHTRKELERSGFGWVFNCPGVEVEEESND